VYEPYIVRKWQDYHILFRLVFTGVGFEFQKGDDQKGYKVCEDEFSALADVLYFSSAVEIDVKSRITFRPDDRGVVQEVDLTALEGDLRPGDKR
jgi:hypothetical protein